MCYIIMNNIYTINENSVVVQNLANNKEIDLWWKYQLNKCMLPSTLKLSASGFIYKTSRTKIWNL
jgi:hypothetical protein